jgi:hypothetical protein
MPPFRRFIQILDAFIAPWPAHLAATSAALPRANPSPASTPARIETPAVACGSAAEIPRVEVGGEFITPVGRRRLHILKFAGQGTRARVFQATDLASQQTCALKVIHERTPLHLQSIAVETTKTDALAAHQLPFARIIETGGTYILKEWIDGIGGDQWLREWLAAGADPDDPAFVSLVQFFRDASAKGLHVGDLRPSNMMLRAGTEWVPIDTGPITASMPPAAAMKCYRERFIRRWLWVGRSPFWYLVYWTWCRTKAAGATAVSSRAEEKR